MASNDSVVVEEGVFLSLKLAITSKRLEIRPTLLYSECFSDDPGIDDLNCYFCVKLWFCAAMSSASVYRRFLSQARQRS